MAGGRERLFVALWPDAGVRRRIAAAAHDARLTTRGGRPVAEDDLHLTVTFLGGVDASLGSAVRALVAGFRAAPCDLVLDRLGYFPRSRVLWLGAGVTPAALTAGKEVLDRDLRRLGCRIEPRPLAPHVTLFRDSRAPPAVALEPIHWPVREWVLVRSSTGERVPRYEIVARSAPGRDG